MCGAAHLCFVPLFTSYSSGWYAPRWRVHPPPAQWREKLWSEAQQTLRPQNIHARHTKVLWHTCRPAVSGVYVCVSMWWSCDVSCDMHVVIFSGVSQDHHQWTATPPATLRLSPHCPCQWYEQTWLLFTVSFPFMNVCNAINSVHESAIYYLARLIG